MGQGTWGPGSETMSWPSFLEPDKVWHSVWPTVDIRAAYTTSFTLPASTTSQPVSFLFERGLYARNNSVTHQGEYGFSEQVWGNGVSGGTPTTISIHADLEMHFEGNQISPSLPASSRALWSDDYCGHGGVSCSPGFGFQYPIRVHSPSYAISFGGGGIPNGHIHGAHTVVTTVDATFYFLPNPLSAVDATEYCVSLQNSTGRPAELQIGGTAEVNENALFASVENTPPGSFGFLLMSRMPDSVLFFGGGWGRLCLGSTIYRFSNDVQQASLLGEVAYRVRLDDLPQGQVVAPGEVMNFQYWFRDAIAGTPTSNTSSAVAVTFR